MEINVYVNIHLKDRLDIEFTAVKASWCQWKRWHHILCLTYIAILLVRHSYWGQRVGHT